MDLKVKPSKIAGQGVFADQDLKPGTKLLRFEGPTMNGWEASGKMEEYCVQVGRDKYYGPSGKLDDLVNHSCAPNAGLKLVGDEVWLVSFKPIEQYEELTFDYSTTVADEDGWTMKCACGASECRGVIGQFSSLPADKRKEYKQLGLDFVNQWEPK